MFLAASSSDPVLAWIFIEATTLSTAFLISFYNRPSATEAAWKYLTLNSIGLLFGFFGSLLYFTAGAPGHAIVTWDSLLQHASSLDPTIAKMAFAFILVGYGTKIGLVPMHSWKPDAYSKAPAPVAALLSGALVNVAFLVMLRFREITDTAAGPAFSQTLLIGFGLASIAFATFMIFGQKNYKRLLTYSSIEHAGIVTLGFAFGGIGSFGAILLMMYHALVKSSLFFTAGNIFVKYGSSKVADVKGALAALPLSGVLFMAGVVAIVGIPPLLVIVALIAGYTAAGVSTFLWAVILALACFAIAFTGFLKITSSMVFGTIPQGILKGESGLWTTIPPAFLLLVALILSFWTPSFIGDIISEILLTY